MTLVCPVSILFPCCCSSSPLHYKPVWSEFTAL